MLRRALIGVVVFSMPVAGTAQTSAGAGVTVGAGRLSDARTEQAITGVLQLRPRPWLMLSVIPSVVRVSDDTGAAPIATAGLGDLPLVAGVSSTVSTSWSPTFGGALIVSLPTGNAACGLGSGQTAVGFDAGLGIAPAAGLRFSADGSRNFSGLADQTFLRFEAAADVAPRWTLALGAGVELGSVDSLARTAGGGITYAIAGPLALTVNASHGLTAASPAWVVSVGIGTVFTGISPVAPTSPLRRLQGSFAGGVGRSTGHGPGKTTCG